MTEREAIGVLECVRRNEIKRNNKINKLCTSLGESLGARAIDMAIVALEREIETEQILKFPVKVNGTVFGRRIVAADYADRTITIKLEG